LKVNLAAFIHSLSNRKTQVNRGFSSGLQILNAGHSTAPGSGRTLILCRPNGTCWWQPLLSQILGNLLIWETSFLLVQLPPVAVTDTLQPWSLAFHMFLSPAGFHNKDILPLGQFITASLNTSPPTHALGITSASSRKNRTKAHQPYKNCIVDL